MRPRFSRVGDRECGWSLGGAVHISKPSFLVRIVHAVLILLPGNGQAFNLSKGGRGGRRIGNEEKRKERKVTQEEEHKKLHHSSG